MLKKEGEPTEVEKSTLNEIFDILKSDSEKNQQMMLCRRSGDLLDFHTLFGSEIDSQVAYEKLTQLGQKPRLQGRKVFLTAEFPGEEIDELAGRSHSIPKTKDKEEVY